MKLKPRQGKTYVLSFKDGTISTLKAKTVDEAVMRARLGLMDAPVPDGEMEHADPGIGCVHSGE